MAGKVADYRLGDASRAWIDLEATGILKALAHDRTFEARPRMDGLVRVTGKDLDLAIAVQFPALGILPLGDDLGESDRRQILENMRGPKVLAADRHPDLSFEGRFTGGLDQGLLDGRLLVRGQGRPLRFPVRVAREDGSLVARGSWSGTLGDLGIAPFKALLGAIRLKDRARIRFEAHFEPA